ncbi:hypothetical protein [Rathayibacter sp. VKM Ac-2857]|uniref:hypothetical protein n=1 Tax=Rathayibacter sp. VKM Ac-2857 TaxID=2739020 RepID=UPI0015646FED|nr:hypothetical protein [Rathayibacter sp. VKM Ac-2857]NQX18212.1 hypothetical protein [Rathayibacter sp. VKM Ac-2857]
MPPASTARRPHSWPVASAAIGGSGAVDVLIALAVLSTRDQRSGPQDEPFLDAGPRRPADAMTD